MSKNELKIFKTYLNKHLINDFIRLFKFFAKISILFIKKNENLRLCVDYKNLNNIIIKNRYFLFLINENLNRLNKTTIYNQFDLIVAYHRIKIKKKTNEKQFFAFVIIISNIRCFFFDLINVFVSF